MQPGLCLDADNDTTGQKFLTLGTLNGIELSHYSYWSLGRVSLGILQKSQMMYKSPGTANIPAELGQV
jgi:hypothetical protein